jgi:hypothetical protein
VTLGAGDQVRQRVIATGRQRIGRPPPQVLRLVADRDLRAGRCVRHELQVEMAGWHAQRARDGVDVDRDQFGRDTQVAYTGFLDGLAQCRGHDVVVAIVAVPAELYPATKPRMQGEQHLMAAVVEHQRGSGDVARYALTTAGVGAAVHEGQRRMPQRILGRIGGLPVGEDRDRRLSNVH